GFEAGDDQQGGADYEQHGQHPDDHDQDGCSSASGGWVRYEHGLELRWGPAGKWRAALTAAWGGFRPAPRSGAGGWPGPSGRRFGRTASGLVRARPGRTGPPEILPCAPIIVEAWCPV